MKEKIGYGICVCIMCLVSFYLTYQWKELNRFSNQAGIRYDKGGLSGAQIEEYNKKQAEESEKTENAEQVEVTAWSLEKEQYISWEETGQQAEGTVIRIYGNMTPILPFFMKYGGFTFHEDSSGCVISSGLAWKLFGAEDVVGNVVEYEEKRLEIRGVLNLDEPVLAMYQTKKQEVMPYVEVQTQEKPPAARMEQIKSSLGLFGEVYDFNGSFYCSIARILLSLPFWMVFFYLSRRFLKWYKTLPESRKKWCGAAGKTLILLGIAIGIRCSISFTSDFIPAQWSDFGFWSEKWREVIGGIRERSRCQGIYWEQEVIGRLARIAGGVAVSLAALGRLAYIYKRKQKKFQ